jgi:hypothetical protein
VINVARILDPLEAIAGFAVVKLHEAVTLRDAGISKPVLLLGPFATTELSPQVAVYVSAGACIRLSLRYPPAIASLKSEASQLWPSVMSRPCSTRRTARDRKISLSRARRPCTISRCICTEICRGVFCRPR